MLNKVLKLGRQKLWLAHREYLNRNHELKYLFWECTMNCNFKCRHCGSQAGENVFEDSVSTDDIKKAFLDVSKNFDATKITIGVTGGEPLLRKDLFEVMGYASSLGFGWGMISNGYLVTEEIVEKARKAKMGTADISIDGIGSVHDEFRNMPGAYERAINAVRLFKKANFLNHLRITTTVNKNNIDSLDRMYAEFLKLGILNWRPLSIDPIGRTMDKGDLLLDREQFMTLLQFIKDKRKEKSKLSVTFGCAHYLGEEFEDEVRGNFFHCSTGINIGSILYNGDIFVCPNVPREKHLIQGNIKKDAFSDMWSNEYKLFREDERLESEKCKSCESWEECRGGSFHSWNFERKQPKICYMDRKLYP